ncbi:unnamed protein product [Scytosiphon promiscuus]
MASAGETEGRHHASHDDGGRANSLGTAAPTHPAPAPASGEHETAVAQAAGGTTETEEAVMPVADVMALLQAMREEQLDSLKKIADGVQQLQSQVMVLGESATASEGNTSLLLDRLASLEVRIGSIPVPMQPQTKAPPRVQQQHYQPRQQIRHDARASSGAGGPPGGVQGAVKSQPPVARKVPPPPPAAVEEPGRIPTWQARGEPEPHRPHFMRNASPQQKPSSVSSVKTVPTATSSKAVASPTAERSIGAKGGSSGVSPEEAAKKEAKRLAFIEDRARIQARISARNGNGAAPSVGKPAQTTAPPPTPTKGTPATVQAQPRAFETPTAGLSSPFAAPPVGGGAFSTDSRGPGAGSVGGDVGASDDEAAWLEREKVQREERERARREEEQRVERQRAEAKRLREEEEARKIREAEEARKREKARLEAEAKRQAKTRILMSSLFDKASDEDDGNSLFGGIGGASLPVFHDDSTNNHHGGAGAGAGSTDQDEKRVAPASSITETAPNTLLTGLGSGVDNDRGGSGAGLFGGIEEPDAHRGGMFDAIDDPRSSHLEGDSSAVRGMSTRKAYTMNDGRDAGGAMLPEAETFPSQSASLSGASHTGSRNGSESGVEPGGYSGLFDSSPPLESSSSYRGNEGSAAMSSRTTATADGPTSEIEDFFSTLQTAEPSAPSVAVDSSGPTATARGSIFEDDDLFGSSFVANAGRAEAAKKANVKEGARGTSGGSSLFDRPEFSIESGEDDVGNVFGGGGGGGGGVDGDGVGMRDASTSFLSAMGDVGLLADEDDGVSRSGAERDGVGAEREGMVEVSL